jgi:argininosuccinate lyase
MARVVTESVTLHPAVPEQAAAESWVVATDLAEALARNGTPFHRAHQIVGNLVLESVRAGKPPSAWGPDELTSFAPEFTAEMARFFKPAEGMKTRSVVGGTAPETVRAALDEARARLNVMG